MFRERRPCKNTRRTPWQKEERVVSNDAACPSYSRKFASSIASFHKPGKSSPALDLQRHPF